MSDMTTHHTLMAAIKLSLAIGIFMLVMKVYAYVITGSSAIFSDAAESVVHNVAVGFALFSLWYSMRPADRKHLYGHDKISYFSAGVEGVLIILAAFVIIFDAIRKWTAGLELEHLGRGIVFTSSAFLINGALGAYLVWRGRKHHSLIIEANGKHVLTDSWTSLGVIVGLVLVHVTGWRPFDPICAILVALNILWSGFDLMRRSVGGLLDTADPEIDRAVREVLEKETKARGVIFHQLRHRSSGITTWAEFHLLFPDDTALKTAHAQATEIERAVQERLGEGAHITTHLEPREDHARVHHHAPTAESSGR